MWRVPFHKAISTIFFCSNFSHDEHLQHAKLWSGKILVPMKCICFLSGDVLQTELADQTRKPTIKIINKQTTMLIFRVSVPLLTSNYLVTIHKATVHACCKIQRRVHPSVALKQLVVKFTTKATVTAPSSSRVQYHPVRKANCLSLQVHDCQLKSKLLSDNCQ